MVYNSYLTNITGADRAEMLKVIDDDDAFDRWREQFDRKMSAPPKSAGRVSMSKEDFINKKGTYRPPGT